MTAMRLAILLVLTLAGTAACTTPGNDPPPPGANAPAPAGKSTPQDLAYCARLSALYTRYVGPDPNSPSLGGVMPDVTGGEAVAKCREGDARASIPVLERLLTDADITLPPRT